MEFPKGFGHGLDEQCLILDSYMKDNNPLIIDNKKFGLMLAINIHRSEMVFRIEKGGHKLIELLKKNSIYPYSYLNRDPVILLKRIQGILLFEV